MKFKSFFYVKMEITYELIPIKNIPKRALLNTQPEDLEEYLLLSKLNKLSDDAHNYYFNKINQ